MNKEWIKRLKKKLKPRGRAMIKPEFIYSEPYTFQCLKEPPPGYKDWDKKALSKEQQHYMVDELSSLVKTNEEYIYYHPQVIALLCMMVRSLSKHQPDNVRKHLRRLLKNPVLDIEVNFFLLQRGYRKNEDLLEHEKEVELDNKLLDDYYLSVPKYGHCLRSELPLPERTAKAFRKTHWKEPYPEYSVKWANTVQYTMPHFIKNTKQYYPLRPSF